MISDLRGLFFGKFIAEGYSTAGLEATYSFLDLMFIFIIAISFIVYYQLYRYIRQSNFPENLKKTSKYIIGTLSLLNLIFIGIIAEFVNIRFIHQIYLPIPIRIFWLILAVVALCLMLKAYTSLKTETAPSKKSKKTKIKNRE